MNFNTKALSLVVIFTIVLFTDNCVLGSCGLNHLEKLANHYKNTVIRSDQVACLFPVEDKCPHGMLRVDSEEQGKKACDERVQAVLVGYETNGEAYPKDPRFCCLLSQTVDLKVKESPCTGGSTGHKTYL